MSWGRRFFLGGVERLSANMFVSNIFALALEMCGNAGQRTIIEDIGMQGYRDAMNAALDGGDAVSVLMDLASHPDAVEQILEETGGQIQEIADEITGSILEADE